MHTISKINKLEFIEGSGHLLTLEQPKNHDNGEEHEAFGHAEDEQGQG